MNTINTVEDIVELIMKRDRIDEYEAQRLVDGCIAELDELMATSDGYGLYDEAADIVAEYLNLEPDFLDILIDEC